VLKIKILRKTTSSKKRKFLPLSVVLIFIFAATINVSLLSFYSQETKDKNISHAIAVTAISIAVTVQDKGGRYINNLTKEDFSVYENDEKKDISYFNHDFKAPLSLTILLDVSGSMALQHKLEESKIALRYLATSLLDIKDEFSLLIFADGEVEVAMNFCNYKSYFLTLLKKTEAYGQTALNDAVAVTPEFANKGSNEKRAILLITDGIENDSQYSHYQAVEIARRVDIPIYTIGYKIPLSDQYLKKYKHSPSLTSSGIVYSLERFSKATGGKAFFINQAEDLKSALREMKKELSHQYILGYTSYSNPEKEYRRIKVIASKKSYKVRAREGYYSGEKKSP
jgi:Ca-activated chloride channel family protein